MEASAPAFSKRFKLDPNILGSDSSNDVDVDLSTDHDIVRAFIEDGEFPTRPTGKIELGRLLLNGNVKFKADVAQTGGTAVGFSFGGTACAGAGIYDNPAQALQALELEEVPELDLSLEDDAGTRFLLLRAGYAVSGSVEASHPLGVFGSFKFGAEARHQQLYAVLHRFAQSKKARKVMEDTVTSWRLPRHVRQAEDLKPGTWILAEVDGSLALSLSAQLGYDLSYVQQVKIPGTAGGTGLSGDLGLKIETGLKATLGLTASGRYFLLVGRESDDPASQEIRLRLFKMAKNGFTFGLNLAASVQAIDTLSPDSVDDLVKAVFGVHGLQAIKDLQAIEKWTDPTSKLSDLVAGLANEKGLELLREATGIDPAASFETARSALTNVLKQWESLPAAVSSKLWSLLGTLNDRAIRALREGLRSLAAGDNQQRQDALLKLLASAGLDGTPIGLWLMALADQGILALTNEVDRVSEAARATLAALEGDLIRRLQKFLEDRLNLDLLRRVESELDFNRLDSFLVNRLSLFLDEELSFRNLDKIRGAIHQAVRLREEIYQRARSALARKYDFNLAFSYQKATSRTALLDVTFNLAKPQALSLFEGVIARSDLDRLLVSQTQGVSLRQAVLTHEINRRSEIQVSFPKFDFAKESLASSLAKVRATDDGGRVLLYELHSENVVQIKNQLRSQFNLALSMGVAAQTRVRIHSHDTANVSYRFLQAKENMRLAELKHLTQPFILKYLPGLFEAPGTPSLETWYLHLDRTVENAVSNGINEFGDVLADMEVTVPAAALAAWLHPRSDLQRRVQAQEVSKSVQSAVKRLIPFYYFQDLDRLQQNPSAAALLVWASIPACTSARADGDKLILDAQAGNDVYWNFPDPELRRKMVMNQKATGSLAASLVAAAERLRESDRQRGRAKFFGADQAGSFQHMALARDAGDDLLGTLLFVEAEVVQGVAKALKDVSEFMEAAPDQPQRAVERLTEFGDEVTETFHRKLASVYGGDSLRALGPMVFLEAARVLDHSLASMQPSAMLSLTVLNEKREFKLANFLAGEIPQDKDVVLRQRLVSPASHL